MGEHVENLACEIADRIANNTRTASALDQLERPNSRTIIVAGREMGTLCECGHPVTAHKTKVKDRGCYDCTCKRFFEPRVQVIKKKEI